VVCGEPVTSRIDAHALTNPVLLVEVTSRSTEDYDRGEKLGHYQSLASLRAVIFVSHRERRLTLVSRSPSGWTTHDFVSGQRVVLTEPAVSLAVDEVYAGIALDPA
jgi:Uma2 family endonuclease